MLRTRLFGLVALFLVVSLAGCRHCSSCSKSASPAGCSSCSKSAPGPARGCRPRLPALRVLCGSCGSTDPRPGRAINGNLLQV